MLIDSFVPRAHARKAPETAGELFNMCKQMDLEADSAEIAINQTFLHRVL